MQSNIDSLTVQGFGEEWSQFTQSELDPEELDSVFKRYFSVFPWERLPEAATGFDLGCGSGRWAARVAPRVGQLHCIDASADALEVARRNLRDAANCHFHCASVDAIPLPDGSQDFGYSLGVLHHVPDTRAGLRSCIEKLKLGAPFLVYLYYAFDNRPAWYRLLWRASDQLRLRIARLPHAKKIRVTRAIAAIIYFPLARASALAERLGFAVSNWPLAFYRHHSFYTMCTDSLDRFGTRLEQRFTAAEIRSMMEAVGLEEIRFHPGEPFWCAVGIRAR